MAISDTGSARPIDARGDALGRWLSEYSPTLLLGLLLVLLPAAASDFVLTQIVGLPYAAAAEVCRVPIGTIRSRVARAREELQSSLRQEETG